MNDIPHSRPWIDQSDHEAVRRSLDSGMLAEGEGVRVFEQTVAASVGCTGAVATSSGTAALILALEAVEVPAGSEVILPTYACPAVLDAVLAVGAVPIPCDVGEHWNMTVETASSKRSARTGAVIVVSTFGISNPAEAYRDLEVPIIEDRCQDFLPQRSETEGETGDVQVYSFHATKCLTTGEGGAAASRDTDLLRRMRAVRDGHGPAARLTRSRAARMSDLQAALGLSQLARYDQFLTRRKSLAESYYEALTGLPFDLPREIRRLSAFFRFPLRWPVEFDRLRNQFGDRSIHVRRGVDTLLHRILGFDSDQYPNAEKLFSETVSIPIYPALNDRDRDRVVEACHDLADSL